MTPGELQKLQSHASRSSANSRGLLGPALTLLVTILLLVGGYEVLRSGILTNLLHAPIKELRGSWRLRALDRLPARSPFPPLGGTYAPFRREIGDDPRVTIEFRVDKTVQLRMESSNHMFTMAGAGAFSVEPGRVITINMENLDLARRFVLLVSLMSAPNDDPESPSSGGLVPPPLLPIGPQLQFEYHREKDLLVLTTRMASSLFPTEVQLTWTRVTQ